MTSEVKAEDVEMKKNGKTLKYGSIKVGAQKIEVYDVPKQLDLQEQFALCTGYAFGANDREFLESVSFGHAVGGFVIEHGMEPERMKALGYNAYASECFGGDIYGPVLLYQSNPVTGNTVNFKVVTFVKLMQERQKKRKGSVKNVSEDEVYTFQEDKNVIVCGPRPLYRGPDARPVKCERCEAQAVSPVIEVTHVGMFYLCPVHHPKYDGKA